MTVVLPHRSEGRPVVVTGGCGFIGCNMAKALAQRGERVLILDSLAREGSQENAHWLKKQFGRAVQIRVCDVRDRAAMQSSIATAAAVIHLAAQVAVTTSVDDPVEDFETNAGGTLNVLEAVRLSNPQAPVLFASTNKVYGRLFSDRDVRRDRQRYVPCDAARLAGVGENTPIDLYSPYGCSKGAADQYVRDYSRVYGLRSAVLRMSCIYGPRQFGTEDQGWIAHFFVQAIRGHSLTIFGDGYQVRDALHVDDAVAAWLAVLDNIDAVRGRVFNLGGGPDNSVSLRELLATMAEMEREPESVRYAEWRPGDQPWFVTDVRALREAVGWRPRISLREGLVTVDAWLAARFGRSLDMALTAEAGG